jgi:hypothetical protein
VTADSPDGDRRPLSSANGAHRVAGQFPDGRLYLDLRGYDPEQPVAPAAALATTSPVWWSGTAPAGSIWTSSPRTRRSPCCRRWWGPGSPPNRSPPRPSHSGVPGSRSPCGSPRRWRPRTRLLDHYRWLGRYADALVHFGQSLAGYRAVADHGGAARALARLGVVHERLGNYGEALDRLREALGLYREIGHRHGEGAQLINLGGRYRRLGRYEEAAEHQRQAAAVFVELGDERLQGYALGNLGAVDSLLRATAKRWRGWSSRWRTACEPPTGRRGQRAGHHRRGPGAGRSTGGGAGVPAPGAGDQRRDGRSRPGDGDPEHARRRHARAGRARGGADQTPGRPSGWPATAGTGTNRPAPTKAWPTHCATVVRSRRRTSSGRRRPPSTPHWASHHRAAGPVHGCQ